MRNPLTVCKSVTWASAGKLADLTVRACGNRAEVGETMSEWIRNAVRKAAKC